MQTNADCTIYNARLDSETGYDVYVKTIIKGVHWFSQMLNTVTGTGLASAESLTMRIPDTAVADFDKSFITPAKWRALTTLESEEHYTLQPGDKIVKGAQDFEVTGLTGHKWSDIEKNFDEVMTIVGHADNRSGGLPHIKVVGK